MKDESLNQIFNGLTDFVHANFKEDVLNDYSRLKQKHYIITVFIQSIEKNYDENNVKYNYLI